MTDGVTEATRTERDGRRATIRDVAAAAGVSRSTASRALTGTGYVGRGVRERVQHAAEGLGYVPDAMARHLKQQVSRSLGLLVPDLRAGSAADLVAGVTREAWRRGYATILAADPPSGADEVAAAERFVAMRVAGVVLVGASPDVAGYLTRRRTPVLTVDHHGDHAHPGAVVADDAAPVHDLTRHLLALGHRRLLVLVEPAPQHGDAALVATGPRVDAVLAAVAEVGQPPDTVEVVTAAHDDAAAQATAAALLAGPRPPTAVLAGTARLAAGAWRAVAGLGRMVPADVSLVSFEDAPWMSLVTPGLTAVEVDAVGLGEAAVGRLLARLDGGSLCGEAPGVEAGPRARVRHRASTAAPRAPDADAPAVPPLPPNGSRRQSSGCTG